jgi:hypothetical protein
MILFGAALPSRPGSAIAVKRANRLTAQFLKSELLDR